jgi:hypothetical protein
VSGEHSIWVASTHFAAKKKIRNRPVYTIPGSLVTTSSFAVMEQWLLANAY